MTGPREGLASVTAAAASWASRALRRGKGEIIGGRLALRVAPTYLASLAAGRTCVLVTGTNGKSTVTSLVAAALGVEAAVASNRTGANMPDGIVTALRADPTAPLASLEVDEVYLQQVVNAVRPRAVVVLNLSREYTRGISLGRTLDHWRSVAVSLPTGTTVVANVDDPLVQYAFEDAEHVVPVAGGLSWLADAAVCPACGGLLADLGGAWTCHGCGRHRAEPSWSASEAYAVSNLVQETLVSGPHGALTVRTAVPGRTAAVSAAFALAAASAVGIEATSATLAIESVMDVDGRYRPFRLGGREIRILMLKNPAGWSEAIDTALRSDLPLVVAVEPFGPRDTTTMWEAPWERLAGRRVAVSGGRSLDAVACLDAAGVSTAVAADVLDAVAVHPPGRVIVACNYPAFRQLTRRLRAMGA